MAEVILSVNRSKVLTLAAIAVMLVAAFAVCISLDASDAAESTKKYTLKFETDGGTEIASIEVKEGITLYEALDSVAEPTKAGHNFVGWYNKALDTMIPEGMKVVKDMTLYAKWMDPETQAHVVFLSETNGGGESISNAIVDKDSKVSEPSKPSLNGYKFVGWYTMETDAETGDLVLQKFDFGTKITEDTTLFAMWEETSLFGGIVDFITENPMTLIAIVLAAVFVLAYYYTGFPAFIIAAVVMALIALVLQVGWIDVGFH